MAQLAIQGHATRGKEVIEILEMLGGSNPHNYSADCDSLCFYIGKDTNSIYYDWVRDYYKNGNTLVFTLEEFLEKYPHKVGDKVSSKYLKNYEVSKMEWESANNRVIYKLQGMGWYSADELQPYKEETMEEKGTLVKIDLTRELCIANEVEVILGDYEFVLKDGKTYFVKKKPKYPNTYEECCKILQVTHTEWHGYLGEVLVPFQKLLICRNAYWMIAGGWKFDFDKPGYHLFNEYGSVQKFEGTIDCSGILSFPTKEMRDAFYENFKELIEECKEFL